ncbi:MBL fold metallo-hydrolase [Xanthomonas arboricola pv. corylina]|uniref:4-amino-L-phenylalanyl-[CmlP-peptidyl-carrier-pro tein] 3-hydroxylase n=1 Tax=Xanthomonas arboricola pv. corylina TaxID=487821 RepID=A0A2S7C274_9XANT|nr:MBL fold metallo-hydrolase [Xanthomonas arboricola]MEB2125611.1 MBL fold metallo-hydrolase [Xanthomonas campestris pv. campestris]MDN0205310.1 MBL fold metallo-hydrolase [Xanthomonas arboricola pv. corylina]MDN0218223.1 MBL fold metallo-hydrolase [Xanthomonas arboricola pv. corylina]PPU55685.1 hypothetical protein XacyCFBP1159_21035 [Xanthomonas arboricola pv. corylina]CAE6772407.1 4-amino-L-phenylalanyl-[CmlP-peptidyl-carrier-protein] 3-hydroxylase [Xanthomonas arboricola pv. corylina]
MLSNEIRRAGEDVAYLKPGVKLEPLICRWYAWSHLVSPVQLALHVAFRMQPLLKSFMNNPSVHLSASADPKMYGGPFMGLGADDLDAVRELNLKTEQECESLIGLANDLRRLAGSLPEKANGYSLNEMYAELPDSLKGLVEFQYDTNNHASVRFFESMVYGEYDTAHTHEILLEEIDDAERPFFMSTPRLRTSNGVSLPLTFDDPRIDTLSSMRTSAGSVSEVARQLEVSEQDLPRFRSFFTSEVPVAKPHRSLEQDGVRMRFFGHACVLLQTQDVSILFDPFVALAPGDDGRLTLNDLPDHIDYVVLTHSHQDHFSAEMLLQLRHRIGRVVVPSNNCGSVADPSMKLALQRLGFERIDVLSPLDVIALPEGSLQSLPFTGEHADLNIYSKHAIALKLKGTTSLFLIDSDGRDVALYARILRLIGKVDALFIGMECQGAPLNWLYEPLLNKPLNRRNNESRRLSGADCERAWSIISTLAPSRVFVYAMGQEPWMKYIMGLEYEPDSVQLVESNRLIERCLEHSIESERLFSGREMYF